LDIPDIPQNFVGKFVVFSEPVQPKKLPHTFAATRSKSHWILIEAIRDALQVLSSFGGRRPMEVAMC